MKTPPPSESNPVQPGTTKAENAAMGGLTGSGDAEEFAHKTEWKRLTPEQRLMQVSQTAQFVALYRGAARRLS